MQEKTFALSRRALLRTAAVGAAATAATATIPSVVMAADGVAADTSKIRNFDMIEAFYREYPKKLAVVRGTLNRPLTLTEKILFTHLYHPESLREFKRGVDYIELRPDRAGTHDIGGPMAIIQFLSSGKERIALPAALVCDHLVQANVCAIPDLKVAEKGNVETYEFLRDVSRRYGFDFWPAGSGICHQVFMENYNFPGCMMLVTDSHTPTACGMGMLAIGVGGADLVDALMGMEWELKMPKIIGVKLTGQLQGWASAKDVILKLTGMLSTKGATNCVVEFFGEGAATLSASGKATIGNMGAEMGATTSVFAYDDSMARYLAATGRQAVADLASKVDLAADKEVYADPAKYYDRVVEINLSELEPHINGPFSPDAAMPISKVAETVKAKGYPQQLQVALIGSCTNSSYEDITRAASIARQALENGVEIKTPLMVVPGSTRIYDTLKRDGNPLTNAFLASPEMVMAMAINGDLTFNPLEGTVRTAKGTNMKLAAPVGQELPAKGFVSDIKGCVIPDFEKIEIKVNPTAERIRLLEPFPAWDGQDFTALPLLIKAKGKCTTDHISPGGKWLPYRGNIDRISDNLLERAVNAFNGVSGKVWNTDTNAYDTPAKVARHYRNNNIASVIVGDDNYGEGSSREHAAMEPRYLNVRVVLAKSLARIHESNLKKQGILALTFVNPADYDKIQEKDRISVLNLNTLAPNSRVVIELTHENGTKERFEAKHSYNEKQLSWFRAGSALNALKA